MGERKLSVRQIKNVIVRLKASVESLKKIPMDTEGSKTFYYKQEETFKGILNDDWDKLSEVVDKMDSKDVIYVLSLMSTYRPREPWQVLRDIGILNDAVNKE